MPVRREALGQEPQSCHCASSFSGMGISGGLVGAHVLARQVNEHPDDPSTALAAYDAELRLFVDAVQASVRPRLLRLSMPTSRAGVLAVEAGAAVAGALHVPALLARRATTDRGGAWALPPDPRTVEDAGLALLEPPESGRSQPS